jgi:hypothetical protein
LATVLAMGVGAGVVLPEVVGSVFPTAKILFYGGILGLIGLAWTDSDLDAAWRRYLAWIVLYSVIYRVRVFTFGGSMLGDDPDIYAVQVSRLMARGDVAAITIGFYNRAPVHILEASIVGLVTAVPADLASLVFPAMVGIVWPLVAAAVIGRLRPGVPRLAILGAGGVSLMTYSVRYAWIPIAQTSGFVFVALSLFAFLVYVTTRRWPWIGLSVLGMAAAVYTHKLAPLAIMLAVATAIIVHVLRVEGDREFTPRMILGLIGVYGILTTVQLVFITTQLRAVLLPTIPQQAGVSSELAASGRRPIFVLSQQLYVYTLGTVSGLVWLEWWRQSAKSNNVSHVVFLSIVGALAGLSVLLFVTPFNVARAIYYSEFFLVVLIIVGTYELSKTYPIPRGVVLGLVVFLALTSGLSPTTSPDQGVERQYLSDQEVEAKDWGIRYVAGDVQTDLYYANEATPHQIRTSGRGPAGAPSVYSDRAFVVGSEHYLNRSLQSDAATPFAHRSCTGVVVTDRGRVRLPYDAGRALDTAHARFYDSSCVKFYR